MNKPWITLSAAAAFLAFGAATASAEELRQTVILNDASASTEAIENALFPEDVQKLKQECAELVKAGFKCQSVIPKASLSTTVVTFERGSARLTQSSQDFLRRIGDVLKKRHDALDGLVIEGHTDATGSKDINLRLSRARADAVRKFLATEFGIGKLETRGRGSANLKDSADPGSAANRRIEFVNQ